MSERYTTWGSVRGCCGHEHKSREAAERCAAKDGASCRSLGGGAYSDRTVREVEGGSRGEDGTLAWWQGQHGEHLERA